MGIEYSSLYLDETYRFHVVWAKSAGTIFRTRIPSPENFAEYTFSVFINGLELNEQDYKAYSWNDNGTYRVVIELLNGLQFNVDDFIVVWVRTRLDVNDVDFAEGQRLSAQKLKTIFVRILQKLEELKSAGFAFASPMVLMQLGKNVADIAPRLAAAAEADVDAHVDTVSKPEIDNYVETVSKPELNNHVETVNKPEIDNYVETVSKPEIDSYVDTVSKPAIDNYVDTVSKPAIDNYVETSAKPAVDNHVEAVAKPAIDNYVKPAVDNYVDTVIKPEIVNYGKQAIDNYVDTSAKPAIDSYVDTSAKPEIDNHVETSAKPAIDNYVDTSAKPEIDSYVDTSAKPEINNHVETSAKPAIDNYLNTTVYPAIDAYWDNLANNTTLNADTLDGLHATDFVQQDSAGNVIISGNLETAGDTIVKGINVLKTFPPAIPEGSTAYFKKQLIDELGGIKPDGYDGSTVASYGLRTSSDNATLVVTERKDDVPFEGVVSFAVEEGTTNLVAKYGQSALYDKANWLNVDVEVVFDPTCPVGNGYVAKLDASANSDWEDFGSVTLPSSEFAPGDVFTVSFWFKGDSLPNMTDTRVVHNDGTYKLPILTWIERPTPSPSKWQRYVLQYTIPEPDSGKTFVHWNPLRWNYHPSSTAVGYLSPIQVEKKPFATSLVDGTRPDGILKFTNPPLRLDNFVINFWFKPTRYPSQTGNWLHLVNVSYNADSWRGIVITAPPEPYDVLPANALYLSIRQGDIRTFYNLGFDLSKEVGKWHMFTLISNGNIVDVYINGEKRVSAINEVQRSAIEFIVFGRDFRYLYETGHQSGFLISNLLFASYDPAVWTDSYIRFLYETQKTFYV